MCDPTSEKPDMGHPAAICVDLETNLGRELSDTRVLSAGDDTE